MTEPYAIFAASTIALVALAAWGVAEAIALPIVPDVLLGILVVCAPDQTAALLAATILGGVAGALAMWILLRTRPRAAAAIIRLQPGLGDRGMREATERLRHRGALVGIAQIGPGLPLKAYLAALRELAPRTGYAEITVLALTNRLARIGPVALVFALVAPLIEDAPLSPITFGALYVLGWSAFYGVYWTRRDPRRREMANHRDEGQIG